MNKYRVSNLYSGEIDLKRICLLLSGFTHFCYHRYQQQGCPGIAYGIPDDVSWNHSSPKFFVPGLALISESESMQKH